MGITLSQFYFVSHCLFKVCSKGEIVHPEIKTNSESALLLQLLKPAGPRVCVVKQEKPPQKVA